MAPKQASAGSGSGSARRGKPPTLTEEQIVDAALNIIRAEGLDALSMRRLSRELGRSAMAPYWYVSDKAELLDLVTRKLMSDVKLPEPDSGTWEERLREVLTGIDAKLHDHPGIAAVLLERMLLTHRRLMNGIMDILIDAGFEGAEVFLSYAMIHTYLFGRYQVVEIKTPDPNAELPEDLEDTLQRLIPHVAGLRGRDFFNYGIDTIIAGLQTQLAAKKKRPRGRR
ncbi:MULTISPECIES: TetR/AcrR family transcriptional regulator C-terminal domain-containing protein [Mycolicibacterium]|uniref:TetR/AcrR family transcriptional regulator C-terminal domain-containing protein n=1 Tax=Mycolicibacterium TaxID=1866885 RepID=UPI0009DAB44B|nr:TetR/AcrR family transcriptional regulator C-terminal domain-containing protein [Mycolicibacterium phlei]